MQQIIGMNPLINDGIIKRFLNMVSVFTGGIVPTEKLENRALKIPINTLIF
jgi:hypothetical protein